MIQSTNEETLELIDGAVRQVWRAARPFTLTLTLAPFAVGVVWRGDQDSWTWLTAVALIACHCAANILNELVDFQRGTDDLALADSGSVVTTPGILLSGGSAVVLRRTAVALFALCLLVGLAALLMGRELLTAVLWAGVVLAYGYSARPLALAYRGHGLGELAAIGGYGLLPALVAGGGTFRWELLLLGLPLGLLAAVLLLTHHFLHWQADKVAAKMTPVVVWGERGGWWVVGAGMALAFITLWLNVQLDLVGAWVLWSGLTLIPLTHSWLNMRRFPSPESTFTHIQFLTQAHVIVTILLLVAGKRP